MNSNHSATMLFRKLIVLHLTILSELIERERLKPECCVTVLSGTKEDS
jgi:hypothetical protein